MSAFCCASIDSRSDSCESIWFCTDSSELTSPACLSKVRSCAIAASSEVTRLPTSATCWVTSWACCASESWVPSPPPDSAASVVAYWATGILNVTVAVAWLGCPEPEAAFSVDTYPPAAETIDVACEIADSTLAARTVSCAV